MALRRMNHARYGAVNRREAKCEAGPSKSESCAKPSCGRRRQPFMAYHQERNATVAIKAAARIERRLLPMALADARTPCAKPTWRHEAATGKIWRRNARRHGRELAAPSWRALRRSVVVKIMASICRLDDVAQHRRCPSNLSLCHLPGK